MTFMIMPAASGDPEQFLTQAAVLPPACSVLVEYLLPGVVLGNGMGDHQRRHLSCAPCDIIFLPKENISGGCRGCKCRGASVPGPGGVRDLERPPLAESGNPACPRRGASVV